MQAAYCVQSHQPKQVCICRKSVCLRGGGAWPLFVCESLGSAVSTRVYHRFRIWDPSYEPVASTVEAIRSEFICIHCRISTLEARQKRGVGRRGAEAIRIRFKQMSPAPKSALNRAVWASAIQSVDETSKNLSTCVQPDQWRNSKHYY